MEPTQEVQPKVPTGILIISTLIIVFSLLSLLSIAVAILMDGAELVQIIPPGTFPVPVLLGLTFIIDILMIIVAIGLRRLKLKALKGYTALICISVVIAFIHTKDASSLLGVIVPGLVLLYLWSQRVKFVNQLHPQER